jgi:hypothetical protein
MEADEVREAVWSQGGFGYLLDHREALHQQGFYEVALLEALTMPRGNTSWLPLAFLHRLIAEADRRRLLAAGDPLPPQLAYRLYRGVAGRGAARRIRGLSWSLSLEKAQWFATRGAEFFGLPDPAVYTVRIPCWDVLAYINDRQEQEIITILPEWVRPRRVKPLEGPYHA